MSIGLYAQAACIWEATARKVGNVHRFRDFDDTGYLDFLLSAAAIAPVLNKASGQGVGVTVLQAIEATRQVVPTNTNLGIVLLLAPLATVPLDTELGIGIRTVNKGLSVEDARAVYTAIRLAAPAGLGRVDEQDLGQEPTQTLRHVMILAADRDLVALQYANGFEQVLDTGVGALSHGLEQTGSLEGAIIFCHLLLMAEHPDTLIGRKRGFAEAAEASRGARRILNAGWPQEQAGQKEFDILDAWMREQGNSRNPGATADLVAASLFAALRQDTIHLPPRVRWSCEFITYGEHGP